MLSNLLLTKWTAQGPRSKNLPRRSKARSLWTWLRRTYISMCNDTFIYCYIIESSSKRGRLYWLCFGLTYNHSTWSTMGSCSGGLRSFLPMASHTWNAVSCWEKNKLFCWKMDKSTCQLNFTWPGYFLHNLWDLKTVLPEISFHS